MDPQPKRGVSRHDLDKSFEAEEARKSSLLLEARLLRAQQQDEAAAERFAQAAEIEERLSDLCDARGLAEKSVVHRFSAASCWAQAGNFYRAIALSDDLLTRSDLSSRLRQRIEEYARTLRTRRAQWYAGLLVEAAAGEGFG